MYSRLFNLLCLLCFKTVADTRVIQFRLVPDRLSYVGPYKVTLQIVCCKLCPCNSQSCHHDQCCQTRADDTALVNIKERGLTMLYFALITSQRNDRIMLCRMLVSLGMQNCVRRRDSNNDQAFEMLQQ